MKPVQVQKREIHLGEIPLRASLQRKEDLLSPALSSGFRSEERGIQALRFAEGFIDSDVMSLMNGTHRLVRRMGQSGSFALPVVGGPEPDCSDASRGLDQDSYSHDFSKAVFAAQLGA